ncbi:hypothetical protein Daura_32395 [Dactylosporangium aurantiacum]|uniref:Uncharacterized protein n=1 Tax=Dactylosporangium aurantiacum TaxID=35754 RepID=A0A9Q9I8P6_9ACTN|nr:STM3941 family protein [Dactylosporangium aurantiacum]MDG6107141.1 hypothetical protein [Dactylosporangium aurantiacum]UWZ51437.1 hypothetical protein Daura_32395 [Dactylosporangium aurantiacum]
MSPEPLVIRPRTGRLLLTALGAAGFTVAGGYLVASGGLEETLAGLLSIAFFGGGLLLVLAQAVRHGGSQVTLAPDGLRLRHGGTIGWADIEAVTWQPKPGGMVQIRLRDPERYIASAPPDANAAMRRFLLPFAALLSLRGTRGMRQFARDVRSYGDEIRYYRATFGFDVALAGVWLDRPGEEFVALLERYRRDATA